MRDKRKLCLANGSAEFWVIDPKAREVKIWTPDGRSITYSAGQQVPFVGYAIAVDQIF